MIQKSVIALWSKTMVLAQGLILLQMMMSVNSETLPCLKHLICIISAHSPSFWAPVICQALGTPSEWHFFFLFFCFLLKILQCWHIIHRIKFWFHHYRGWPFLSFQSHLLPLIYIFHFSWAIEVSGFFLFPTSKIYFFCLKFSFCINSLLLVIQISA